MTNTNRNSMTDIDDLQSRVSFQEDLIESLNQRVADQESELQILKVQLKHLATKLNASYQDDDGGSVDDERPPHY